LKALAILGLADLFKYIVDCFAASPKIVQLMNRQQFHWCVYYEIKGHPSPSHSWLFNGRPLNYTEDVSDSSTNPRQGSFTFIFVDPNVKNFSPKTK
jgi:hypothetical protein